MKTQLQIFFLIISMIFTNVALARLNVIEIMGDGRQKEVLASNDPKYEGFFLIKQNLKVYGAQYYLDTNPQNIWEIVFADEGIELVAAKNGTYLLTGARTGNVHIKNNKGQERKLILNWEPLQNRIVVNNCGRGAPTLVPKAPQEDDMLLATQCRLENKKLYFTISTLADVAWLESTIFETAGKGERWRYYQLPAWTKNGGTIAELKFKIGDQEKTFNIVAPMNDEVQKKTELKKQQLDLSSVFENELRLLTMGLTFSADTVSGTDSKMALGYSFISPKYFERFRFGGLFETSVEANKKDDSLSFLEALIYGGYVHAFSEQFDLGTYLGFQYADFQQKSTAARMQNSQTGVFLNSSYLINPTNRVQFMIYKTTFVSQTIKANLGLELSYKYKFQSFMNGMWLGAFYKTQNFDAVNATGVARQFKENVMGVSLVF